MNDVPVNEKRVPINPIGGENTTRKRYGLLADAPKYVVVIQSSSLRTGQCTDQNSLLTRQQREWSCIDS